VPERSECVCKENMGEGRCLKVSVCAGIKRAKETMGENAKQSVRNEEGKEFARAYRRKRGWRGDRHKETSRCTKNKKEQERLQKTKYPPPTPKKNSPKKPHTLSHTPAGLD